MDVETVPTGRGQSTVLLISDDANLIQRIGDLAGVVGSAVEVAMPGTVSRSGWVASGLVLLDARVARDLAPGGLPRRAGVILLVPASGAEGVNPWQVALSAGCSEVATLPESEPRLLDQLEALHLGAPRDGRLIAVIGVTGGIGASTLAAGLALCHRDRRCVLIDTDEHGGGIDVLLGAERTPGIRWSDLHSAQGRLSPATLDYALPHAHGIALVSFGRADRMRLAPETVRSVLDVTTRGYDLVVVDLARWWLSAAAPGPNDSDDVPGQRADAILSRADGCVILVRNSVRSVAAAATTIDAVRRAGSEAVVALRRHPRGLSARDVSSALSLTSVIEVPDERSIETSGEIGEPPGSRSQLIRTCLRIHDHLVA